MNELTAKLAEALRLVMDQFWLPTNDRHRALWKRQQPMFLAAREALRLYEQAKPAEPVAVVRRGQHFDQINYLVSPELLPDGTTLFAAPVAQAEPRKPLTEQEVAEAVFDYYEGMRQEVAEKHFPKDLAIFRIAEAAHGIKENQP